MDLAVYWRLERQVSVTVMNSKTMYILVGVLVIIIVAAGVGIYLFMGTGGEGGGNGGGETPVDTYTVANATSLQFDVNITTSGVVGTYNFAAKNLNSSDILLRVDSNPVVSDGTIYSNIMYASNQTAYSNATGTWAVSDFATDWPTWSTEFENYKTQLTSNWSGTGDLSYTDASENAIVIFNIKVQPSLPDSLFQSM
jgi:hypothetical protein